MKIKPLPSYFELETATSSQTPKKFTKNIHLFSKRRVRTENIPNQDSNCTHSPTKSFSTSKQDKPLPRTHFEYIKAKKDIDYSQKRAQERNKQFSLKSTNRQRLQYDLKLAFIIRQQTFGSSKFLHKSSFEESIGSPMPKGRLDPIRESIEFESNGFRQEAIGKRVIHKDWEKRWENLFEAYFELEEMKAKNFTNLCDEAIQQPPPKWVTLEEIEILMQELRKNHRNYKLIDQCLEKIKFFTYFEKIIRYRIIDHCKLKYYEQNSLIISKSFNIDNVYVILRGSCKIKVQAHTTKGAIVEFVVGSIYEGSHFGQQNLVIEKKIEDIKKMKKHELWIGQKMQYINSSIFAQEDSHLLEISRDLYENVLIKSIETELNNKIHVLQRVKILMHNNKEQLIPLAAIISIEKYKYGDLIIDKDDVISKLYIVSNGSLKTCICTRAVVDLKNILNNQDQSSLYQYTEKPQPRRSIPNCNKIKLTENLMEFNKHIDMQQFEIGNIFGTSAFLTLEDIELHNKYKTNRIAQLSIAVCSQNAEVLTLDPLQFEALPESLQLQIRELVLSNREFDDIDVQSVTKQSEDWSTVKQAYYRSAAIVKLRSKSYK